MSERELQTAIIECARWLGWRVAHFRPALTKQGWRTPVEADGQGFPDLVLVRERVVYAELKSSTGRPSAAQRDWAKWLTAAGSEIYLWRPEDWTTGRVETVLRERKELAA